MSSKKKYKLEVITLGLKLFERNRDSCSKSLAAAETGAGCSYRLLQEGLEFLLPHMDDRRLVDVEDSLLF